MKLIYTLIYLFILIPCAHGQGQSIFNLNEEYGLPSNHVYSIITDRHGYLWIATNKGVVKYNGYECKVFNKSNGLPNDDVWQLLEDKKGRIWLGSITEKAGYIFNDKYQSVPLKNFSGTLFPRDMRLKDSGITLFFVNILDKISVINFIERDDTLFPFYWHDSLYKNENKNVHHIPAPLHNSEGESYCINSDKIYKIKYDPNDKTGKCSISGYSTFPKKDTELYINQLCYLIGNKIVSVKTAKKWPNISITNVDDGKKTDIKVAATEDDYINLVSFKEKKEETNTFYIFSKNEIKKCTLFDTFRIVDTKKIRDYVADLDGQNIACIHENDKWGYCIGTTTTGVYFINKAPFFVPSKLSIPGFTYVGGKTNTSAFWWSSKDNELAFITKDKFVKSKLSNIKSIKSVGQKTNDEYLISSEHLWNYNAKNNKITEFPFAKYGSGFAGAWFRTDSDFYGAGNHGLYYEKTRHGNYTRTYLDHSRYHGIEYDSIRKCIWSYNNNKIIKVSKDTSTFLNKDELERHGINEIENLLTDQSYGNIIIKDGNRLLLFDPERMKSLPLFSDIIFNGKAYVGISKNILTVTWRYGILFAKLSGKMKISKPMVFINYKNIKYKNIYGACVIDDKLQINTDRGLFMVNIPEFNSSKSDTENMAPVINSVIVANGGTIHRLVSGDTIVLNGIDRKIIFDIIKPSGSGVPKYYYSLDSKKEESLLNSNELDIPATFKPDEYHKLCIYVTDNISKGGIITLYLYIYPKWWQTKLARRLIVIGGILLAILILTSIVFITRNAVLRASHKKQLQMELELKAIYAQINPHFIFNTLTSALLLVSKNKMDEAYIHISKFSKLLRSYLKSSRNKFITLADEIDNLKIYTELQQTRFKNRFVCDIIVDNKLDAEQVNIPSLLIQPFVENAINHGILSSDKPGILTIEFISVDNKIVCTISDNGVGRQKSIEDKKRQEHMLGSYGNMMIKDLVDVFNKYEKMDIQITYEDKKEPETGTSVIIMISNVNI